MAKQKVTAYLTEQTVRHATGDVYVKDNHVAVMAQGKQTIFPFANAHQIIIEEAR